jgi:hypothetical protein
MISLCPAPFRLPVLATAAFLMGSTRGTATQIIWDTLIDRPHATSAGQPLPATTIFLLGVFDREFTPTAANRTEWAQRWHTASIARWDPATRYFSGEVNFTSNPIPFTSGNAAWVWGIAGSEWILLRRSTWNWPTGSPLGGPPIFWTANSSVTTAMPRSWGEAPPDAWTPPKFRATWDQKKKTKTKQTIKETSKRREVSRVCTIS